MIRPRHRITPCVISVLVLAGAGTAAAAPAKKADRNHDGIPDRWERAHRLSLKVDQSKRDQDHDGLSNRYEYLSGTSPRKRDTDGDGCPDGAEDRDLDRVSNLLEQQLGTKPNNGDSNTNGIPDGLEVVAAAETIQGAVTSYDAATGLLVVTPTDGTVAREVRVLATTVQERIGTQGLIPGLPVSVEFVLTAAGTLDATRIVGPEPVVTPSTKAPKSKQKAWEGRWDRFLEAEHRWTWKGYWSQYWRSHPAKGSVKDWDRHWTDYWRREVTVTWREGAHGTWSRRGHRTSKKHDSSKRAGARNHESRGNRKGNENHRNRSNHERRENHDDHGRSKGD